MHLDQLYGLFLDNQFNLKKIIVDLYCILPPSKMYEKVYLNLTNQYNGYIVSLLIDYESQDMYKVTIYNIFTQGYVYINTDIHSICQAIHDIRYNKVPFIYS